MNFTLKNRLRFLPETVIVSIIAVPLILTEKSTHFMYNHTCRMGNGSGSRRRLLNPVQAALKSPFSITFTEKYEGSTDGMVNVATPDAKGFIPMMELIDRDKELARLNKELTKAEKELGMFTNQLNNPKFVEKAPAKLVEETRAKLAAAQDKAAKIKESIAALG